jgi:hypothetical protein
LIDQMCLNRYVLLLSPPIFNIFPQVLAQCSPFFRTTRVCDYNSHKTKNTKFQS